MKTLKMTYKVISENQFAQKTVSAIVGRNPNAFYQFEEKVKERLGDNIKINHTGKIVILL